MTDKGGWVYSPNNGECRINCIHKDRSGEIYGEIRGENGDSTNTVRNDLARFLLVIFEY